MVYPSRGEGFGITPLEAMATGLPAIVPNAHGITEYFNAGYMLEVKVAEKCPGLYHSFKGQDVGEMVICDVNDLRQQMRFAYNHQQQMKQLVKPPASTSSATLTRLQLASWPRLSTAGRRPKSSSGRTASTSTSR